jgi:polysaccharide export outer membrane protein
MLIGAGDLLEVSVYGADFDKQVRVSDTGEISLPLVGPLKVSGLSIHDAEQAVAKQLSQRGYFNDPQVWVFEREYATQAISVLGEVQKPGIYPLPGDRKLFDAISAASGTTATAGSQVAITHRGRPNHPEIVQFSYDANAIQGSNPRVFPGDTVVVSKAGIVYVVGDVRQPKGIVMENSRMTVLQAIAIAQGTNPTAALDSAKIVRKSAHGGPQETPIRLKKILAAKAPDPTLQAEDILFIPTSTAKSAGKRTLEAIVQAATGLAVYHPY